jgi:hypothetical protein
MSYEVKRTLLRLVDVKFAATTTGRAVTTTDTTGTARTVSSTGRRLLLLLLRIKLSLASIASLSTAYILLRTRLVDATGYANIVAYRRASTPVAELDAV